jgi:uncharacterized delta-60 repeat protein
MIISHSNTSGLTPFQSRILRLLQDGNVDNSFPVIMNEYEILPFDQDHFYTRSGGSGSVIRRRSTLDGSLDTTFTFNPDPWQTGEVMAIGEVEVLSDGKLLISGWIELSDTANNWVGEYDLVRINWSGGLDTTFAPRKANGFLQDLHIMPDGQHLISGQQSSYGLSSVTPTFRISPTGILDNSFNVDHIYLGKGPFNIIQQPDGKYLVAGRLFYYINLLDIDTLEVVRWNEDGSLDSTFNNWNHFGLSGYSSGHDIEILGDGRLLVTGNFEDVNNEPRGGVAMLDANGNLLPDPFEEGGCGPDGMQTYARLYVAQSGTRYLYGSFSGFTDDTGSHQIDHLVKLNATDVSVPEHRAPLLEVYPVPFQDHILIRVEGFNKPHSGRALIFDATGRRVLEVNVILDQHETRINLSDLSPGSYTIVVQCEEAIALSKSITKIP